MVARMVPPPMGFLAPNRHCDVSVWRWGSPLFRPQRALLAPPVRSRGSRGILTAVGVTGRLSHRIWGSLLPIQDGRVVNGPHGRRRQFPPNFDGKPAARRGAAAEVGASLLEHLFDMMGTWPPTKFSAFSAH